jgi:hypothetical protein
MKKLSLLLLLLGATLAACTSTPERTLMPVENATFRLGTRPDGVEVRIESGFYPSSGYELVTTAAVTSNLSDGVTISLEGVQAPPEPRGPRGPAAALVFLPVGKVDGVKWPLQFRIPLGDGGARVDPYQVEHSAAGWKLSKSQGGFSRYEAQGSY